MESRVDPFTTIFVIKAPKVVIPDHPCNNQFRVSCDDSEESGQSSDSFDEEDIEEDADSSNDSDPNDDDGGDNTARHRQRERTPLIQNPDSIYAFRTSDKHLKSSSGWVFGSDHKRCDFLLAENHKTGVSGKHFSIEVERSARVLLLRNWSGRKTRVLAGNEIPDVNTVTVIDKDVFIQAGAVKLFVRILVRDRNQRNEYERSLDLFLANGDDVVPEFHDLAFRSASMTPATVRGRKSDYFLASIIGAGIFGTVHLAYAPTKGKSAQFFAVKEFSTDTNDEMTDKARAEIKLLMKLSHKHIVCYCDIIESTAPMLVMEYMPRGDLSKFWNSGPEHQEVGLMLQQILQALSYLHKQNVTHRDIKPQNVLVYSAQPFITKLSDFGMASETYLSKTFCGSLLYLAPEGYTARGNRGKSGGYTWYDPAVDIWALGVVGLKYTFGLPTICKNEQPCLDINRNAGQWKGPMAEVLQQMLVLDSEKRASADQALMGLESKLPKFDQDVPDSKSSGCREEDHPTSRPSKRLFGEMTKYNSDVILRRSPSMNIQVSTSVESPRTEKPSRPARECQVDDPNRGADVLIGRLDAATQHSHSDPKQESALMAENTALDSARRPKFAVLVQSVASFAEKSPRNIDMTRATPRRRKIRPADYTVLETAYVKNPAPDKTERMKLVDRVALDQKEIEVWFCNRRQKDRKGSKPLLPHEVELHSRNLTQQQFLSAPVSRETTSVESAQPVCLLAASGSSMNGKLQRRSPKPTTIPEFLNIQHINERDEQCAGEGDKNGQDDSEEDADGEERMGKDNYEGNARVEEFDMFKNSFTAETERSWISRSSDSFGVTYPSDLSIYP